MPDGTSTILHSIYESLKYVIVGLLALLGWNGKRLVARVDKHDEELGDMVKSDTFNETMKSMREYINESTERIERSIQGHNDKLEHVTQRIDRIIESKICHHSQKDHSKD